MKQRLTIVFALALVLILSAFAPAFQRQVFDYVVTKRLTVLEGGALFSSGLDMDSNAIQNVGAAGTDFGSDGSLTTAAGLTITAGGATITAGGLTLSDGNAVIADFVRITAQTSLTVTDSTPFTPTGSYQPITAAGAVTPTIATSGFTAGDQVQIVNTSSQNILIQDTGNQVLSAAFTMGQYDTLTLRFDGTRWLEIARSNN